MAKFKVGDKVIAKKYTPYSITTDGWKGEVIEIGHYSTDTIRVKGKNSFGELDRFLVQSEFFDLDKSFDQKIVITTDGTTTTAKMYHGKTVSKTATATCNPDDKFDFDKGAKIAVDRLLGKTEEKPKFTKSDLKTGMFVHINRGEFAVVVNDKLIYNDGDFDSLSSLTDDLKFRSYEIDAVLNAISFKMARDVIEHNEADHIIWRRGTE